MYRDNIPSYPDDKLILGRYLGPATDIGLALTAKNPSTEWPICLQIDPPTPH
jgi:hypothetical protein